METNKMLRGLGLVALCLVCLIFFSVSRSEAAREIRAATLGIPTTNMHQGLEKWKPLLEERSGGKLSVKVLGRGVMGGDREMIEGCRLGTLDASVVSGSVLGNIVPQFFMVGMPYLFENHEETNAFLDGPLGQKLFKLLEEKDLVGLGWSTWSFRAIYNNVRPITKPEDLKGLKIRTLETPLDVSIMTYMGGVATPLAYGEATMALRQNAIDGLAATFGHGYTLKVYENSKYTSYTKHFYESAPLIMSKKLFYSFSPEEQKIIKATAAEVMLWSRVEQMRVDQEAKADLEKVGQKVNIISTETFNAFRERTKPVYEQFRVKISPEFMDETFAFINSIRKK